MNEGIRFSFEGKSYIANLAFYEYDRASLPDGTFVEPENGWSENLPPTPQGVVRSSNQSYDLPYGVAVEVI